MTNDSWPRREECNYIPDHAWRGKDLTEVTYKNALAVCSINSIGIIPTVVLNALVIFAVSTRRRLRANSNILLACLAGTDLVVGLVIQPLAVAVQMKRVFGTGPFCPLEKAYVVAIVGSGFASLLHLVIISIDRFIAIKEPLRYLDIVTKQRIKTGELSAWAITVFVTIQEIVLAAINSENNIYSIYFKVSGIILFSICALFIVAIVISYAYIFSEIRRQEKRIQTEQLLQEEVKRIKKDNKATITLAIILGTLVLSYLPGLIGFAAIANSDNTVQRRFLWDWSATCISLASLFNPVVYCWRMKKLRHAFLEILHLRQPENSSPVMEMQAIEGRHP